MEDENDRAANCARVWDKSQDREDKTSISEQIDEMEAYCENREIAITARYHEVGRGRSKKRPEFKEDAGCRDMSASGSRHRASRTLAT